MMANREISKLNCPYQKKCGGCLGFSKPYAETLREKEAHVRKLLEGICNVEKITGMEAPLHYRNKVHAAFGWGRKEIVCGLYQESTHKIVSIESCLIEDETADSIIRTVRELMPSFKIAPYDGFRPRRTSRGRLWNGIRRLRRSSRTSMTNGRV